MPLTVRCRCGQELVVRYSEWVYFALALLFLGLVANTTAVILIYSGLRELERDTRAPEPATAEAGERVGRAEPAPSGDTPLPRTAPDPTGTGADTEDGADAGGRVAELPEQAVEVEVPEATKALREPAEDGVAIRGLIELLAARPDEVPNKTSETLDSPIVAEAPQFREVTGAPRLLALALVRSARSDDVVAAHLLHPDAYLRQQALDELRERGVFDREPGGWPQLAAILRSAGSIAGHVPGIERWTALPAELDPLAWSGLEQEARIELSALPEAGLRAFIDDAATRGIDIVLAIDSTESMDATLRDLPRVASWLVPALAWSLPGLRIGLVLYKDEIESTVDLSDAPDRDVLPALLDATAAGGGDVPEGVYTALRAALELGRFHWRPGAMKHIVIAGDQSPPYADKDRFVTLATAAHRDGEYRVHLLAVSPDGDVPVAYFPEFAAAGQGRHAICPAREIGAEILRTLLPAPYDAHGERIASLLRETFGH